MTNALLTRFTFLILSPFISRKRLTALFGKDLWADPELKPIFEELNGTAEVKPFECVGTVEEVRACVEAMEGNRANVEVILHRFNDEHFLPQRFEQLLKNHLHV